MNIHPGSVTGTGWAGIENALVQEVTEDALFDNFKRGNSAQVTVIEPVVMEDGSGAEPPVATSTEETSEISEPASSEAGTTTEETSPLSEEEVSREPDTQESEPEPSETISPESTPEPELTPEPISEPEPIPEPEPVGETTGESALQSLSKSFFKFVHRATQRLPFVQESIVTPVPPSEPAPTPESAPEENQPEEEAPAEVVPETVPEPAPEVTPETLPEEAGEEIVPEVTPEPVPETEIPSVEEGSVSTTTPTGESEGVAPSEGAVEEVEPEEPLTAEERNRALCDKSKCYTHVLEFGDFSVGGNLEDQQITNMQLRVSLGARPHQKALLGGEHIKVEYLHYDYWIDGGVIIVDDEVSNAINGGYFLFAFPLYSEWEEMNRIKVRLTYESDNEQLSDIFVDSVWLEVESINHDAFLDPQPGPVPELSAEEKQAIPEEYYYDLMTEQAEFAHDETPRFVFDLKHRVKDKGFFERLGNRIQSFLGIDATEQTTRRIQMRIVDDEFEGIAEIKEQEDGSYVLDIPKIRQFKPGHHVVTIEVTDGDTVFYIEQEFTWGVLALNADKSIYLPGEEAYLQMGVLDDLGHTICDARLDLTVTSPTGVIQYLSTESATIHYSNECAGDTYVTSPDYDAGYVFTDGVGTYEMTLTATTENGSHTIADRVEVREAVPFDIVREGPTRIYPVEPYAVTLTLTANEDYVGEIIELVPTSFQVYERGGQSFRTHEVGGAKQLIWDVALTAGETFELSYRFDAPDTSPEFYLLGPLSVGAFAEVREWQIASDAPSNAIIVQSVIGTPASATSYSATLGSAPTAGNIIIMVAMQRDGASAFNAPASYLTQAVLSNAGAEIDIGIWYAPANSASTTYTITKTGGNQGGVVALFEVAGLDADNPLNVTASNNQTGSNSRTAYTGATAVSTPFGFALAAVGFADNDFANPTSGNWSSDSVNPYTQNSWTEWAAGNDGSLGLAYTNVNIADTQGATLTVTGGGTTEQRNSVLAVFNLAPQTNTVGALGNQVPQLKINTANNYVGGAFTIATDNGTTSVTSITISEAGTTNAAVDLSSIRLYYEFDTSAPYDCASESYDGGEAQYGATSTAFSSANGTSTFTGAVTVATTSTMCAYTVMDIDASATVGHTIEIEIEDPSVDVVSGTGSTSPATAVAISDTSTISLGYSPSVTLLETPTFPSMKATTTQPAFGEFVGTDADGDAVEYEFSIDDDPLFGSPATTTYSINYPSDAGWASSTFPTGATTTYHIQEQLPVGTTYWWRVRGRDPLNTNTWGQYSEVRSLTVGSDITVPEWHQTTGAQLSSPTVSTNVTTSGDSLVIDDLTTEVSLLNSWSTGNTKTISSGSSRLLLVAIVSEDSGTSVNVNAVTYGGQTLTEITDQQIGTGFANGMWVGYLDEAGIDASSGTTITPSWTGGTPDNGIAYTSAVFENVDQSNPIRGYSPNALTSGDTITPASSVSVLDGDMAFYVAETEDGLTHTPDTGYTEGTEQNTGGTGFVAASAYKSVTADGTEFPTATWSATGNRLLIVAGAIASAAAEGSVMSEPIDFDWVSNQDDWGEISWNVTKTGDHDTRLRLYYGTSTACSTIVPDGALAGNSTGFSATSSPLNISSLATTTYNRICLEMTLSEGTGSTSPSLNDWTVSWELRPVFAQVAYRWYANRNNITPADSWPVGTTSSELGENDPIVSENPTKTGDVLRLRLGASVSSVSATGGAFKLQYAEGSACDASLSWQDVAPIGSTTALWRGYNNAGVADGATLSSSTLSSTDDFETYEEENNSATLPNTISVGDQGEWDWVLENGAEAGTSYCFRMVGSDGTPFSTYTEYPLLVTNQAAVIQTTDTPFDNEKLASTSPWFEFTGVDPEGNEIDYQIQIDNNADFSSTVIDTESATNLTDFLNLQTPADKSPFNDSETIRYTIPSALTNGITYWWRVRAIDSTGSDTFGDWTTPQSFTVDTSLTITTWFQTTEAQFDTDALVGTDATGANLVQFASGSTTGTTTSTAVDFDDVTTGNAWGEFSFSETGGANNILYHIEYYDGDSWELIPDADLTGNAIGFDTSPVDLIDLDTETYNDIRIRANFNAGSPTLLDWTIEWGLRVSVPTHLLLFDNEKTGTTSPSFTFFTTDPENDVLEYQFSWSTDNTFASGSTTVNSSTSPGFVNVDNGGDTNPFNSGDTIRYSMQSALSNGVTYWWRVRAKDPLGGDSYSFWSNPWSFTVDTTATTSTWFQTTEEQFDTDTLVSTIASVSDTVTTVPATVTTYNFVGITNPSVTHIARDFEVDVNDPTDPPTVDEIDTLTTTGLTTGAPNLRSAIAGYASDAEASTAQYTAISTSNNSRWQITDPGNGDNAVFWTQFEIAEDASNIVEITVNLEGYKGGGADTAWLGIWRPGSTTPYWQYLDDSPATSDNVLTGTITTNIDQYLDGNNNLHVVFFNEDISQSLFVDYVEVVVTSDAADSGTVTGTPIDFNDGSGPAWGVMAWSDAEPGGSSLTYQLEYLNGSGVWELIPDAALSGNSTGFTTSSVSLKLLNTTTYNEIRPVGNLVCSGLNCPSVNDWTITWSPGFTITGTAFEYDGVSSSTSGTVMVAVNGALQTGKTGTISNGSWSIPNVTFFEDDVVTVFVDGAADADEAVAITRFDGVPDMSGLLLQKRHLTIGSDDFATVTHADLATYDFTNDEDLFFDVTGGNDLSMCADIGCTDAGIVILSGNTYEPGSGADVTTHDFRNDGTFTSGANSIRLSGSWDNNATSTMTGSSVIFTATSTSETVDSTGAISSTFNNVTFGEGSGTATWTLGSALDVDGNLSVQYGTLARTALSIAVAGNLTTGASGFWSGIGTTTFDGINPGTWTDNNATKQNIGRVVVDGTSKTLLLGSNVTMQSLTVGANDTFDLSITGHSPSVYEDWTNNGTFVHRTGTVHFIATTTSRIITAGGDSFYNLNFNGAGGSWSFTEANLGVTNDLSIATGTVTMPTGTTTVAGSFTNSGGTFAHNNALMYFTGSAAETLTLSSTAFTNAFYNVRFTGSGSWSFTEANATTSNNFRITQGTVTMPGGTLVVGGSFINTAGTFAHNGGTTKFTSAGAETIDTNSSFYNLLFTGSGSWSFIDTNVTTLNNLTTSAGTLTLPSGTLTLGGSLINTAVLSHNNGTVLFNATTTGKTIATGASSLYNATFNSAAGGWTVTAHATTTNNVTLTTANSFTLASGQTLSVGGTFTNSVGGASTTWTGSTLSLEAGAYSLNAKTNTGDAYDTLRIKANTDIKMWNSSSTVYDVDATGSLYSQDHSGVDGDLYIFGAYERTSGNEYWSYATDFDGTALGGSGRQVDVRFASGASATFTGATVEIIGTPSATTTVERQVDGLYGITLSNSTLDAEHYDIRHQNLLGLQLLDGTLISSLENGHFTLDAVGGSLITVSDTTIDANPALQIHAVTFDTSLGTSSNLTTGDGEDTFIFFDDFNDGSIDSGKWTKDIELGSITETGGYLRAGGGITSGNYGHVSLGSEVGYADFLDNSVVWRARNSLNGIGELAFRGDFGTNQGYKVRFDQRTGANGQAFLESPYSGWTFSNGSGTCASDSLEPVTDQWYRYEVTASSTNYIMYRDGAAMRNCTDNTFMSAGEIALQNHYGSYTDYDWVGVRSFVTPQPTSTSWMAEEEVHPGMYREGHVVTGSTVGAQTDYVLPIVVNYGTATDSGAAMYCNGLCNADFSDVRFADESGSALSYWRDESYTSSSSATFWVKFDTIPASPATTSIYVYYGDVVGYNVSQEGGAPTSYWWFRDSLGDIDGEAFDNDTGDPGSVRWDDSSLVITVSGTVYEDDGLTTMGNPTCDDATNNVRIVVQGGSSYTGDCASADGTYSIPGVVIVGDPVVTAYLDTNGGSKGTVVTRTPTANVTDLDIYENRVVTRHEDTESMTILKMSAYDHDDDADISYVAATGTLTVFANTELHIASSTTFAPGGNITISGNASSTSYDGSLHIDNDAIFTGSATSTYTIGGSFTMDEGATFTSASTTVLMNATTTGKTITTTASQEINFYNLEFNGAGGGWNINGDIRAVQDIDVTAGTVSGTADITVENGSLSGNGLLSMGSGTTTIHRTNTLGGTTPWTFGNLVLGNGSVTGTTTPASNATTTVLGRLTISTGHYLDAGASHWDLAGTGTVFVEQGTFLEDTSTVRYSGTAAANILSTTYYNLDLMAQGGSPTYTATGLGIIVSNDLTIGGPGTTTVTFNTNDPAVDVNGDVIIDSTGTLIGSASAVFTVGGSWDNNGIFTGSNGTVTFDNGGTKTIAAGNSSFSNVTMNGAGDFTISEHATTTGAFTLTNATSFTVASGQSLAIGGIFTNGIGGAATTWTGSTLFLYGGGDYEVNSSSLGDTYETLAIGAGTLIHTWNSSAATVDTHSTGALYSQDHAGVDGDLYVYGSYQHTSGTDYWSYTTDFDGTNLTGGSERKVDVYFAPGASAVYTGGGLQILGDSSASTTIQNQGSGTYSLRIGGTASTSMSYYEIRDADSSGLTFSGTPNVVTLSRGDFEVGTNGGSALTVGGTVITQNPARTFTNNNFGTSTGISPAFNVTATGTSASSWRFTNHTGTIDGESFDVDPNGDPGYVVWDDSAANITVSGTVYSGEGSGVSGACDGSTSNIHLKVAGLTSYLGSCNAGTGAYSIPGVLYSPGDSLVVYIDEEAENAATVTEDPISNISGLDLYENRVIVRHESADPISIADMAVWDSSDDTDIPFTAVDGSPDTLTLPSDWKLIVWTNKEFEPGGNVTLSGGGAGAAYDGTLELYAGAAFDATGAESHTIGGSFIAGVGSTFDDETSTFTFTTTGAGRIIDTNEYSFYNATFNGSGSWTVANTAFDVGNDLTISQGAVTLPNGTTTITGSFSTTGGSFIANGGTMVFNSVAAEIVRAGSSSFNALTFSGSGGYTLQGGNATATADVRVMSGTFTSATGTFAIGGDLINEATFNHGSGLLRFTSATGAIVTAGNSDLYSVTFSGSGSHIFTDEDVALLGSLSILSGDVTLATGTMSIGGSFLNTGGSFDHASGTLLFNSSNTGESINPGASPFNIVSLASAGGGWTITGDATTTGSFSLVSATNFTQSSSTRLTVGGVFTNLVGGAATTWTGSTLAINSGSGYTVNTKASGGDVYHNVLIGSSTALRAWDSTGNITMMDADSSFYSQDHAGVSGSLYIFGDYTRSSGADYWSHATDFDGTALGGSSRQAFVYFADGASTTITGGALNIVGANGFDTTVSNQGSGTYGVNVLGGTLNAQYYSFANMGATGLVLSGLATISSLTEGNFTLAVNGGSLITLASTTLNFNAGLVISGASFATTSAITGYNVNLQGTTPSAWTFTGHTGNLDGESFDNDGGDACGSLRWSDSSCLLTTQSAYRFRNDDGGEGVPDSEWYDLDWSKRKRVTVANADASPYTDAAVKLTVTYDADMQADFEDLRFTENDGLTPIDHFIESYTASTDAVVWVKVPTLAASSDAEVYMYYGNGAVSDTSATTTFSFMDDFEDGNLSEYSGDTSLFAVDGTFAYEGSYGIDATGNESAKATDGIYRTNVTVSQGQTLRYLQYIDTGAGSGDETCTMFGVQSPGSNNQNYAVCLELFGVDRVSISKDVDFNDTSGTVLATTTISYVTGWHEVEIDWGTDDSISVTVSQDGTVAATTSATDSSYTQGGVGFTFWFQNGGWDIYSSRPLLTTEPTTTVGAEQVSGGASWIAAVNSPAMGIQADTNVRARFLIENTGLAITAQNFELEFAPKGGAPSCESVDYNDYAEVPNVASCGTSDICMESSTHITNLESTTDLLGGEGTFTSGQVVEDPSNNTGNLDVDANEFTELEYVLVTTENVTDSRYCLRVTDEGADLDSYSRVAELQLVFIPNVTSLTLNGGLDITLTAGATTTVTATGTVSDQNGYADLADATTTIFRSGVGEACSADNNNCYIAGPSSCSFINCAGTSCEVECSADIYYHADPTDIGTFAGETWRALLSVSDQGGSVATATAPSIDLVTLRALAVDDSIDYGTLAVNADTGAYNATTTVENIGNDSIDVAIEGTDLTDGASSAIPVSEQIFATSTFTYSACTFCSSLSTSTTNFELNLGKPTSTTPAITDEVFWGIAVPFGVAGTPHTGSNTFYAVGD